MGATREDEGSGKEAKRRRAPRNLVLKFLRRLPHSNVVCNRLASHLHIGGLDMRYESWKLHKMMAGFEKVVICSRDYSGFIANRVLMMHNDQRGAL
jgi:hypothetical protein